jgi:hypothetical protein
MSFPFWLTEITILRMPCIMNRFIANMSFGCYRHICDEISSSHREWFHLTIRCFLNINRQLKQSRIEISVPSQCNSSLICFLESVFCWTMKWTMIVHLSCSRTYDQDWFAISIWAMLDKWNEPENCQWILFACILKCAFRSCMCHKVLDTHERSVSCSFPRFLQETFTPDDWESKIWSLEHDEQVKRWKDEKKRKN